MIETKIKDKWITETQIKDTDKRDTDKTCTDKRDTDLRALAHIKSDSKLSCSSLHIKFGRSQHAVAYI